MVVWQNPGMTLPLRGAVVAVAMLLVTACGAESATVSSDGESRAPVPNASCEEQLAVLLAELKGDLADDYQPTESPNQLANEYSDYVVRADSVIDITYDSGRVAMTLADLTVLPVHETDLAQPLTIEWSLTSTDAVLLENSRFDEVSVVAFIEEFNGVYQPLVEGLYVGCAADGHAGWFSTAVGAPFISTE